MTHRSEPPGKYRLASSRVRRVLDAGTGWGSAAIMSALLAVVLWQIVVRHAPFGVPSGYARWTEELARVLLLWLTAIGSAYACGSRSHLAIDLLSPRLPTAAARALDVFVQSAIGVFGFVVMAVGGGMLASLTIRLEQVVASLGIPMGAVYLALPLGGGLMAVYAVCNALDGPTTRGGSPSPPPPATGYS